MFITGPDVVRSVLGQEVTLEDLGGASVHNRSSGVAHFLCSSDEECLNTIKQLLSYIPSNNLDNPPIVDTGDDPNRAEQALNSLVPDDPDKSYDMKEVLLAVLDRDSFLEVHALWAPNIIVGFGRLNGRSVGVIANQPRFLAGALDISSSVKGARFVRFCDAFNIPIVTFVDVPGFLPGVEQEQGGIIRQGAKLLYAYCEATVPKLTVIVRKAYGGAYDVLGSKHIRADFNLAWPTAEIAVMGPKGAISIVFRKELAEAPDKQAKRRELVAAYREKFANPYIAAEHGYIDDVIEPSETRSRLISALEAISTKRETRPAKKHDNIPL